MEQSDKVIIKATSAALRILSFRSYTASEIEAKLQKKGYTPEIIAEVLEYCKERRYIDDQEFARQWIIDRKRFKPMGKRLLKQELRQKGVKDEIIESVLENLFDSDEEIKLAIALLTKKLRSNNDIDPEKRKLRLYRLLQRRGFNREAINKAMLDVLKEGDKFNNCQIT